MFKFSNCIKFFTLSLFFLSSFRQAIYANADQAGESEKTTAVHSETLPIPPEIQKELEKIREEALEKQLQSILRLFEQIEFIIEHLAQMVNNNQIKNINREEVRTRLVSLRYVIEMVRKDAFLVINPLTLSALIAVQKALIENLQAIVKDNLKTLPELDLQNTINRSITEQDINFEKIEKAINENQKKINSLDQEAQKVGITRFNRIYRRIEKFVTDYKVTHRVSLAAFLGLGFYYFAGHLPTESISDGYIKNTLQGFKDLVGPTPKINHLTQICTNIPDLKMLGLSHLYLQETGLVNLTAPLLVSWATLYGPFAQDWAIFKNWTKETWNGVCDYVRGDSLSKKKTYDGALIVEPQLTFDDIIGKENIKYEFQHIINYILDPEKFNRGGVAKPSPGFLLYGPPGSGKSCLVEACAGEANKQLRLHGKSDIKLISITPEVIKVIGLSGAIEMAKEFAPSILFIDEIHLCGWQNERDGVGLANALTALSGVMNIGRDPSKTVIVIAATNNPENIDKAMRRNGRFGKELYSDYPSEIDRITYLKRELYNRSQFIPEDYIQQLAKETNGCTLADLKSILQSANQKAKELRQGLTEKHLEEALDSEIRKIILDDFNLPSEQKRVLAIHQAGHALAALLCGEQVSKVTIRPFHVKIQEANVMAKYNSRGTQVQPTKKIEYGKIFGPDSLNEKPIWTRPELLNQLKLCLAGHIAEKIVLGSSGFTYHGYEKSWALDIAKFIVFENLYEKDLPKEKRTELNEKAYQLLTACELEVSTLLKAHKDVLVAIGNALEEKLTLTSPELLEIVKPLGDINKK